MKVADLFAGVGGLSQGFIKAGCSIEFAVEYDASIAASYQKNHPGTDVYNEDISSLDTGDIKKKHPQIDIIIGGPPCQGFSVIGKMDPEDIRSQLIWSFLKAVEIIQPRAFVMENVKALAAIAKWKNVREEFIAKAKELGYGCIPFVVNAAEYGTPQKRERVFLLELEEWKSLEISFLNYYISKRVKHQRYENYSRI